AARPAARATARRWRGRRDRRDDLGIGQDSQQFGEHEIAELILPLRRLTVRRDRQHEVVLRQVREYAAIAKRRAFIEPEQSPEIRFVRLNDIEPEPGFILRRLIKRSTGSLRNELLHLLQLPLRNDSPTKHGTQPLG